MDVRGRESLLKHSVSLALTTIIALVATGCLDGDPTDPGPQERIYGVHAEHRANWLNITGVVGTGIAGCDDGLCIEIYFRDRDPELEEQFPASVEGYPIEFRVMTVDATSTAAEVRDAYVPIWRTLADIVGSGIGLCDDESCIRVYLMEESEEATYGIPEKVEGYVVEKVVTGPIVAQ